MATITITNLSAAPIYLRDFYTTIGATGAKNTAVGPADTLTLASSATGNTALTGGAVKVIHNPADVMRMYQIQQLITAGSITVSVTADANEIGSGFAAQAEGTGLQDVAVARAVFTAASANTDVTVFAVNKVPFQCRAVDSWVSTSTGSASGVIAFYTAAARAGTRVTGDMTAAAAGVTRPGATQPAPAGTLIVPAAAVGIFANITGAAGAITADAFIMLRRE
jgi:hypothetical protein